MLNTSGTHPGTKLVAVVQKPFSIGVSFYFYTLAARLKYMLLFGALTSQRCAFKEQEAPALQFHTAGVHCQPYRSQSSENRKDQA
jgi:hypothetical protein